MFMISILLGMLAVYFLQRIELEQDRPGGGRQAVLLRSAVLASPVVIWVFGSDIAKLIITFGGMLALFLAVRELGDRSARNEDDDLAPRMDQNRRGQPATAGPIPRSRDVTELNMIPNNAFESLKCPNCGGTIRPTSKKCPFCGSQLAPRIELPEPAKLNQIEPGDMIRITRPSSDALSARVLSRILFSELWQARRGVDVPWTDTGNHYAGFILEGDIYLLNWQDRFYFLERSEPVNDQLIVREFGQAARKFGASNQQAAVDLNYDGQNWRMDDIGRFHVKYVEGENAHFKKDAVGRFIHASSSEKALVVEDYQSGAGGQDMVWQGRLISENDINQRRSS